LFAQTDITDQVVGYIKTANVKELAKHFADNIDLAVDDTDDIVSRAQAEQILKKFFDKNQPKNLPSSILVLPNWELSTVLGTWKHPVVISGLALTSRRLATSIRSTSSGLSLHRFLSSRRMLSFAAWN